MKSIPTISIAVLLISIYLFTNCKKKEVPVLTTTQVSNISGTTASCGGEITDEGSGSIISKGLCWSTTPSPKISDSFTNEGGGINNFSSSLNNLTSGTTFFIRAYATNNAGVGYGNEETFTTLMVDIDDNTYNLISIGNKIIIVENLKVTKYRNGDVIGTTTPLDKSILGETNSKYQWPPQGNELNVSTYGRLYTWYAITDSRKICPLGWHVPTREEWNSIINYLGGGGVSGGKLKEEGLEHWMSPNVGANNFSGFSGLPSGSRDLDGRNFGFSKYGYWWTTTEENSDRAINWDLSFENSSTGFGSSPKAEGFSVRCIKDN